MTNIFLKIMPATAANIPPRALKGRPDVMHGCNPCTNKPQANHGCNPCTNKPQANHGCNPCNNHSRAPRVAKTLLLALLLALLAPGAANAQNRAIVTIGEGTHGQIYPLPGWYGYQYSVYLYTPSAAPALDLDCDISSIAFNVSDNSTNTGAKMYIWVKDVDADYALAEATTFSEYTEGATQVYENDDFSSTNGWNTFAFTSDFSHEGGKALLVAVYGVGCTGDGGCGRTCYYTPTESNTQWRKRANNNDPGTNVSGEVIGMRANIQLNLTYTEAVCLSPSGLAASNITDNSATLSWNENGTATAWVLQYGTDSAFGTYTEENVSTTPSFDLTGLTALTIYYARVKPDCDTEGSHWSNTVQFYYIPPCNEPITITADAPYTQGFEIPQGTASDEEGPLPYCWEGYSTNTSNPAPHNAVYEPVHNGTQSLGFYNKSYGDLYAILPEFDTDLNQLQISFWMQTLNGDLGQFQLGYITAEDDGTCNTFTAIETYGPSEDIMTQRTTYLDGLPASAHRLVFKKTEVASPCYIDDVLVMLNDGCYIVQNLRRGGKSHDHIYLSWDLTDNSQTEWDVQVATDADFTENVANLVADSHENYLLDGLDASTHYFVRVKPTCNDNLWSNTIDFTTLCEPIEVTANAPYTEGFESPTGTHYNEAGPLPDCWEAHPIGTKPPHNCNNANYAYSGSQSLVFVAANSSEYAVLPEFSNPFSDLQISFWMRTQNNTNGQLQLGYITAEDDGTCNTFTPVATYDNSVDYVQRTIYLYNVPVTAVRLAFKWEYSHANTALCYIDDVEVEICTLDCYPLGNLSVGEVSTTSAYLSWDLIDNSQTAWDVQVATDAAFTNILVDEETDSHENYLVEGLSMGTTYYVRVKPTCSEDLWKTINFTTECAPITVTANAPYTQDFEGVQGTTQNYWANGQVPACWEAYSTVSYAPHVVNNQGNYPTQTLAFYYNGDYYATLPEFSNPFNQLRIDFKMSTEYVSGSNFTGQLQLGYITAEDDNYSTFTAIANYANHYNYTSFVQRSTILENVPATAQRLVFKWSATNVICYIDDVTVSINPALFPPRDIAVGNITRHEADITWEGLCDSYALRYRQVSFAPALLREGFEGGTMPEGWTIQGSNQDPNRTWRVGVGDNDSETGTHSGNYNALITHNYNNQVTYLVMPTLDLSSYDGLELSFWYINRKRGNNTDPFAVCYRIIGSGSWQVLWSTGTNHETWTKQTVELTGLANIYQIAFRFTDKWGNGVGLDDIVLGGMPLSEWMTVSEAESPHTLTGLTPETAYEVQVKSNCAGDEDWSESVSFTTMGCEIPADLTVSGLMSTSAALAWTGSNDSYNVQYRTKGHYPFSEDFEGEDVIAPGSWTFTSGNTVNGIGGSGTHPAGIYASGDDGDYSPVHGGEKAFRFSSFNSIYSGQSYQQYLISPRLPVTGVLRFYHRRFNTFTENLQVGYSTTTDNLSAFTWSSVSLSTSWQEYTLALPYNVKCVAFRYTAATNRFCVYLDDISIGEWIPAGEWESVEGISGLGTTLSGLQPDTPYEWQVQGICDGEATEWSEIAYFTTEEGITLTKDITGYGTGAGGYYLIASPVMEAVTPTAENGFLTNEYDLYRFNPSGQGNEWENHKANGFVLTNGKGYLYASQENTTLVFTGTPYDGSGEIALEYDPTDSRKCWNLVGNPFPCEAYLDRAYYVLGENGTGINPNAIQGTVPIPPCTAVFVKAVDEGDSVVFTRVAP